MSYINAHDNYKKFEQMVDAYPPHLMKFKPGLRNYIINSTKYVFGRNHLTREQGRKYLKSMTSEPDYQLIGDSAEETLRTKRLGIIR
jgi:hypothetical protein